MIRIIPVIDVKAGIAVHARGGDRRHYAPVRSILHEGSDPFGLARAYRDRLGCDSVYLADLDAIAGKPPDWNLYDRIKDLRVTLWVDAGIVSSEGFKVPGMIAVAGLETIQGPEVLSSLVEERGTDQVAISLDLRDGSPVVSTLDGWGTEDPRGIAEIAIQRGISRLILIDLFRVGTGRGVGTLPLIGAIRQDHPSVEIIAGGGVAGINDLRSLDEAGASAALVGSALHDGRIGLQAR